jgi:hypothetical protein
MKPKDCQRMFMPESLACNGGQIAAAKYFLKKADGYWSRPPFMGLARVCSIFPQLVFS